MFHILAVHLMTFYEFYLQATDVVLKACLSCIFGTRPQLAADRKTGLRQLLELITIFKHVVNSQNI